MNTDLTDFIQTTTDARELKRALAVKMTLAGAAWADVMHDLQVSHAFISKWRSLYARQGIASLRMGYCGSVGYLTAEQKTHILTWLHKQTTWSVPALQEEMRQTFGVEYASKQSYYALMSEARLSWKKSQSQNPKGDPERIAATREAIQKKSRPRYRTL
jgi:putative transposase